MDCPLQLYKGKLKEALTLVPNMSPERRVEAVSYWNVFAEQLQDIVTDIRSTGNSNANVEDDGTNTVYQREPITINATSQGVTSNSAMNSISDALNSAHTSSLIDSNLKQVNAQLNPYHHDDTVHKNLNERSYMAQASTPSHCFSSGKANSVIIGSKSNQSVIDAIPTTTIPTSSYTVSDVECSSQSTTTNVVATCSIANSTGIQQIDPYGLLKQPGSINHTISSDNKTIPSVSSGGGLSGELYCNPIDLAHSTTNAQTIGYITSGDQSSVLADASIGKHDHDSVSDNNYDRLLVAGTRANYSDEVGNGQFDRGPKMFHGINDLNQFVQSVDPIDAIMNTSTAGVSSRSEHFTQSDKPLQQIQLFSSNSEYNPANNLYITASKTIKDIYYSTMCDDQATLAGTSDCQVQVQTMEKESLSSSSNDSSGDSNSNQEVKKEQYKDDTSDKQLSRNQHTCDICGKSGFSTKGNLKRHLRAHSGEKPFKCEFCDSSFTEKKSLKIHVRRHTGEKPYKCEICGKLFSQTGVLQSHMALHLNERKFDCQKCGKAFRQRSQLKLHLMRHDGVKRLECSTCNAKFLTKGDLERHCRIHTGERPYECKICGKTFTRQQSLNEHMNRHTGRKPYDCKFCDKTFSEMSACYKHAKTHTKQDQTQSKMQLRPSNISTS